jgi:uncharacterized protein (DUF1330 family)
VACYLLAEIEVHAPARYREYVEQASAIVARHGGEYLFRSEAITPVSGGWSPGRMILIRFPTREALQRCFGSPEYQAIAHLRESSTSSRAVIVEE